MKKVASVILAVLIVVSLCGCGKHEPPPLYRGDTTERSDASSTQSTRSSTSSATMGERNAVGSAKLYLGATAFSRQGLKDQLLYEGFSDSEAEYGVAHCGANWKEQAYLKAKEYLDIIPFSKSGLIEQLEYEGFTHEQAVYGAEKCGY